MSTQKEKQAIREALMKGADELQILLADYIRESADVVHDTPGSGHYGNQDFRNGMMAAAALIDPDAVNPFTGRPNRESRPRSE